RVLLEHDRAERLHPTAQDPDRIAGGLDRDPGGGALESRSLAHASRGTELRDPLAPARLLGLALRRVAHPEERLVHLVRTLGLGPCLLAHARDRRGIERAEGVRGLGIEPP